MKPNFALKLSNDGAELLHRAAAGWSLVGAVSFENDDVAEACARLLKEAQQLEPSGVRTKLVLPGSEVRYESVVAPGPTDEARRYQIEAEIERLTPYAIDELAYDWSVEDDHALVVICARETLVEAETFAEGYGFNPVSFVAQPDPGQFVGEPFFGETMVAPTLMRAGDSVQPDAEPIRLAAPRRAEAPKPAAQAPVPPVPPAAARPVPPTAARAVDPLPAFTPAARPAPPAGAVTRPPGAREIPTGFPPAKPTAEAKSKVGDLVRRMGTRLRREQAEAPRAEIPATAPKAPAAPSVTPRTPPTPPASAPARPEAAPVGFAHRPAPGTIPGAPAATPVTPPAAPGKPPAAPGTPAAAMPVRPAPVLTPRPVPSTDAKPDSDEESTGTESVSFASRRKPVPVPATAAAATPAARPANPGGRIAVLPAARQADEPGAAQRLIARARAGAASALASATTAAQSAKSKLTPSAAETPAKETAAATPAATPEPQLDRRAPRPGAAEPIVPASRPPVNERDKEREAEAMTIFGARGMQRNETSLARRGLMAAGGAMLLLVAVAVWSIYFSGADQIQIAGNDAQTMPAEGADLPAIAAPQSLAVADPGAAPAPAAVPAPEATDAPVETAAAPDTPAPEAVAEADTPDREQILDNLVQQALNESLPVETLPPPAGDLAVAPGTAPADGSAASDSPQVATAEATAQQLNLPSGFALPPTAEVAFAPPPPPPPYGTEFTFDSRGLVEATPDGALTPSGVTVFAGRPDVVPAPRPAAIVAAAPEPEPAPEPDAAAPAADAAEPDAAPLPVAAAIESAIAEAVGEVPAATPAPADAPVIADDTPRADPALAGFRPLPRPERVRRIGEELQQQQAAPATGDDQTRLDTPAAVDTAAAAPVPAAEPAELASAEAPADEAATRAGETAPATTELAALEAPVAADATLAAFRPAPRPTDLVPEPEPTPELDLSGATPEAVAQSPRPGERPDDIAERARRILAAAAASQAATPAAAAAPAATARGGTDAEDDAGESSASAAAGPVIPSSASVARQATEENAIRLNRINLIGVFGTPNDRRALVRLSSGRVVRVQVGDRLDGGQVAAIGENELHYVKSGRNEVIRIGG